ncbi:MAG: cupin domain-containing protein [Candidatus Acidiferrales bacterium]
MRRVYLMAALLCLAAATAWAQDPVKVDPKHYKVEAENAQVRVLRILYGVGEKSVMHSHPAAVAVFLTDGRTKFTFPDGTSQERDMKAGQAVWSPGETHLPENIGGKPMELILVEIKGTPAKKPAAKAPAKKKSQ